MRQWSKAGDCRAETGHGGAERGKAGHVWQSGARLVTVDLSGATLAQWGEY